MVPHLFLQNVGTTSQKKIKLRSWKRKKDGAPLPLYSLQVGVQGAAVSWGEVTEISLACHFPEAAGKLAGSYTATVRSSWDNAAWSIPDC
jgi:hypothetical protein